MSREASLFQALTATDRLGDLLPVLHHHAVSAVDGRSSILFRFNAEGDTLRAASAFGIERLPNDLRADAIAPAHLFRDGAPVFLADLSGFDAGTRGILGASSAVFVPLRQMQESVGVLVVGCQKAPTDDQLRQVLLVGHAFVLALERATRRDRS